MQRRQWRWHGRIVAFAFILAGHDGKPGCVRGIARATRQQPRTDGRGRGGVWQPLAGRETWEATRSDDRAASRHERSAEPAAMECQ